MTYCQSGAPVTEPVCGCDESKAWKKRAEAAEAKLQLVHSHVKGLALRIDGVLAMVEDVLPKFAPLSEVIAQFQADAPEALSDLEDSLSRMGRLPPDTFPEGAFTELTNESEALVPGEYREQLLASGTVEATANWMAGLVPSRSKSERP
jgi:hypothetical protein